MRLCSSNLHCNMDQVFYSDSEFKEFVELHETQLQSSGVPDHLWPSLCHKLKNQVFDGGEKFVVLQQDYNDLEVGELDPKWAVYISDEAGIEASDKNAIYLVDHAWTYRVENARKHLEEIPSLLGRMSILMGIDVENTTEVEALEMVLTKMWRFNNVYSLKNVSIENQMPIFYVMDELGSAILHSDDPNFRLVPLVYIPEQVTYSILFPIRNGQEGDLVTRNYVEHLTERGSQKERALLLPWRKHDFTGQAFKQYEPDESYFLAGHIEETLPNLEENASGPIIDGNRPLKVYSEYTFINQHLNDSAFEIVDNEQEADILWLTKHFKGFKEFREESPNKFINQFPFENVLTIKDLLSVICRRGNEDTKTDNEALQTQPSWLPTTFNLNTELVEFVSFFQNRQSKGLDNYWIIKPWNLARGLDIQITENIHHIMRLPATGPKIAQKYIENPVLFDRPEIPEGPVKFDVRYVILLRNAESPLEAFVYKNFFLRFANKGFALDHFDDYEKHFTVMNYTQNTLKHMPCKQFLENWKEQYGDNSWNEVEDKICEMLKTILKNALRNGPPAGIGKNPQSRALYAADIMLSWEIDAAKGSKIMQPKILEINWMPDCARACKYYPEFYNDIFKLLFLNQNNSEVFREL